MIQPDLKATIRTVTVVTLTLAGLIWIGLAGGCPLSDWYARRMPPRSYHHVPLSAIMRDLETHAVIPLGTVWEAEALKSVSVTAELRFFPTDREAVRLIAEAAGVVMAYPMDVHGGIMGPIHVRSAAGDRPGVQWLPRVSWQDPTYASER